MRQHSGRTPFFVIPLSFFIHALGTTSTSRGVRKSIFLALFGISYLTIFRTSTEDPPVNYGYATALSSLVFQALDFLILADPSSEFRLIGQKTGISDEDTFLTRHIWAWKLILTPRGIGWAHEPRNVLPPHPKPQPRISFILSQFLTALPWVVFGDAANLALRSHPGFQPNGPSIANVGPFMRILNVFIFALPSVATLQIQYKMYSIIATSVGLYHPEDWPDLFGKWSDGYTIRQFWGRAWHQTMRRWVSAPGNFIAHRVLNLKKGTKLSAYTKLSIAFLVSGTIHQMGDYSLEHRDFWAGGSLSFFLLQAVVIMVEDGIIDAGKRLGIRDGRYVRVLGYLWTVVWFAVTLPIWLDPYFHGGMANAEVSLIGGLWKGDWTGLSVRFSLPLNY
ncbi:membrane bound O-acyl transferase family-domain-containing protein [Lentinula lateritia]|nr:membrane bound O-acyl transferase family-domain-containing protein [Lentinula lateritia]